MQSRNELLDDHFPFHSFEEVVLLTHLEEVFPNSVAFEELLDQYGLLLNLVLVGHLLVLGLHLLLLLPLDERFF